MMQTHNACAGQHFLREDEWVSDLVFGSCGFAGSGRFPVFATCPDALRVSFVAKDVFHGFIAVAPVKIHSGPLQPRPEWGGMFEPGGAGPRPERMIRP